MPLRRIFNTLCGLTEFFFSTFMCVHNKQLKSKGLVEKKKRQKNRSLCKFYVTTNNIIRSMNGFIIMTEEKKNSVLIFI